MQRKMKLLIVARKWFERKGLRQVLASHPRKFRIYDAGTPAEVLTQIKATEFDITILEITGDVEQNLQLITTLKKQHPAGKVLVFSETEDLAVFYLKSGADGFCCKTANSEDFLGAIDTLLSTAESKYLPMDLLLGIVLNGVKLNGRRV